MTGARISGCDRTPTEQRKDTSVFFFCEGGRQGMQVGVATCPSESAVFWLCQKSYSVTFDKSNKTLYTVSRKVVAHNGKNFNASRKG